jgi:hypothetical protein
MTIIEIKEMIITLLNYQDSEINHVIGNRFELSYSKSFQHIRICDMENQTVSCYEEVEESSLSLYNLLHMNHS